MNRINTSMDATAEVRYEPVTAGTFPRLLRRVWAQTDPASRSMRTCDALGHDTPHQRLATHQGDYWICSLTGQFQRDQFPRRPADHYDGQWLPKLMAQQQVDKEVSHWKRRLQRYDPYRRSGRLLEVASGQGALLRAAVELGWQALGNDISPLVAEHAQRQSGAAFLVGPIEQAELEPDVYDVIILNNVLEHLESPMMVLRQLSAALRPGGVMYVQTLSAQSLSMMTQGPRWYYFDPGHLYVPTHVSMAHYIRRVGLTPLQCSTHGFRSRPTHKRDHRTFFRRVFDKVVANFTSLTHTGTRVEYLLQRPKG